MTDKQKFIIYEPNYKSKISFIKILFLLIRNIMDSREIIFQLLKRDVLMIYKKSFLGYSWLFVAPLLGVISWVIMNATGIVNPGDVGIPYPAYVLFSTTIWGLFMGFISSSSNTLQAAQGFIMQVNFHHEALLIKQVAHHMVNFIISFVMSIIVLMVFGVMPSWKIIFFPLAILPLFFLGASIGLFITIIKVVAVDLQRAIEFIISLLMYITPIVYSSKFDNAILQTFMHYNPLTYLVGGVRDLIIYGRMDYIGIYLVLSMLTFIMFIVSIKLFYVSEGKVIEKMI